MTAPTATRLVWSLWALAMALEVAAILLWLANHPVLVSRFGSTADFEPQVFLVPGYATVGAVIAARRRNRIGWLFLAFGLAAALLVFADSYFIRGAIVTPGSLPAARVMGWIGSVLWPSGFLFLCLQLLLFPDGRLPSPRWRPVALALAVSWGLVILDNAFAPRTTTQQGIRFTNPMGIAALGHPAWNAVAQGAVVIAVATLGAAALAPLLRFRRGDPVQRQQLKWFAFGVGISAVTLLVGLAVQGILPIVTTVLATVAFAGVTVGLPAAVGLAILRHRLYDIDRLINRALVYATLTAVLGVGYAGAVLALGQLSGGVGGSAPPAGRWPAPPWPWPPCSSRPAAASRRWSTAASTGASTTRLRPSRRSPPACATRSSWIPSQTELLAVVDQTMEPTHVSLWLRPGPPGSSDTPRSEATPTAWAY